MAKFTSTLFLLVLAAAGAISLPSEKLAAQDSYSPGIRPVMQAGPASTAAFPDAPDVSVTENEVETAVASPAPFVEAAAPRAEIEAHPFWDRQNRLLFAFAGGLAAADFCVTRANLASGGRELNPITRVLSGSTPGLATNFVLEAGSVIGVSYMFHRLGHHRLEHVTSYLNIAGSAGAVAYGLTHR